VTKEPRGLVQRALAALWRDLKSKPIRYWVLVVALVAGGIWASDWIDEKYPSLELRYDAYQALQRTVPREVRAHRVTLVAIGDEEFWKGELDRRIPIKRDYLARLVRSLGAANPSAIGLDYTLRSPVADGSLVESPAYVGETNQLIAAVEEVSQRIPVVLPTTLDEEDYDERDGSYPLESTIFGGHRFSSPNVRFGYTNLFYDKRRVPVAWRVRGVKGLYPSFSLALALADDRRVRFPTDEAVQDKRVVSGHFMEAREIPTVTAGEVLHRPDGPWREMVRSRIAMIGSFCRSDAFRRGRLVDGFLTPVGRVPGLIVHANYVEAWVDTRVIPMFPGWLSHVLEAAISLTVSVLFVSRIRWPGQAFCWLAVVLLAVIGSVFALLNFGAFFDPYLPVLLVAAHSGIEKVLEWRSHYRTQALQAVEDNALMLPPGAASAAS
jgi:CHASE2 domain-containing sensor protein